MCEHHCEVGGHEDRSCDQHEPRYDGGMTRGRCEGRREEVEGGLVEGKHIDVGPLCRCSKASFLARQQGCRAVNGAFNRIQQHPTHCTPGERSFYSEQTTHIRRSEV